MSHDANFLTDNPELYEAQFPDADRLAARFVLDMLGRFGGGRELLDVGCGTGRDAACWTQHGYDVTGLDNSPRMVEHAAARCREADFIVADMREFDLGAVFDVVTCLDSAFLYCHSNAELDSFLDRCRRHLRPGGLLVAEMRNGSFFLGNTELLDGPRERTLSWEGVSYHSSTRLWIDHAEQLLRRERIWDWPGNPRPLTQRSAWRLLFPQELRHVLEHAGFEVLALFDEPGPRTEPAWQPGAELRDGLAGDRLHLIARTVP
ncbi:class I SAM-dependent methyltransferase [Saccharopolyspora sp.]|uniref:class I SAM-dependent DNA methyltransferase n=1 Tax=Saccharopolyspora sp. TaxID=33915 RepID=UPI0025D6A831|nr:class I SAM-dependent methyltransferase [Saccharopolyspora sp.]